MNLNKIIAGSLLALSAVLSAGAEDLKPCPEGCFCFRQSGKIPSNYYPDCQAKATPLYCGYNGQYAWVFRHANGSEKKGKLDCFPSSNIGPLEYDFDEFGEVFWDGAYGLYGTTNSGDFVPMYSDKRYGWTITNDYGVYSCPEEYPLSDQGAKTVKDCYKKNSNGKKVYYIPSHTITLYAGDEGFGEGILTNTNDKQVWIKQGTFSIYKRKFSGSNNNFSLPIITYSPLGSNPDKVFVGWCEDEKRTQKCNKNKTFTGYNVSSNKKYYAKWQRVEKMPDLNVKPNLKPIQAIKIPALSTSR